jgi:hypothetical protein|tara:strand:+ start:278 stop:469 length:192 start_codon:yes stop_codon:yes gene_type:complete
MDNEDQMSERAAILAKKFHHEFAGAMAITNEIDQPPTWDDLPSEYSAALVNTFWTMLQKKDIE